MAQRDYLDDTNSLASVAPVSMGRSTARLVDDPTAPEDRGPRARRPRPEDVNVPGIAPGEVLCDRYIIDEKVTAGGMGVIYKARDLHNAADCAPGTPVALKFSRDDTEDGGRSGRALFLEYRRACRAAGSSVVKVLGFERHQNRHFIAMEWIDGIDLGTVIGGTPMAFGSRTLPIVLRAAEALADVHSRGVVHADVKPGNIMLLPDTSIRIIDFGNLRIPSRSTSDTSSYWATRRYASPDVLSGNKPTTADDVFSLGVIAYELVSGHRPFGTKSSLDASVANLRPKVPDSGSPALDAAILRSLSFDANRRFANAQSMVEAMRGSVDQQTEPVLDVAVDDNGGFSRTGKIASGTGLAAAVAIAAGWILSNGALDLDIDAVEPVQIIEPVVATERPVDGVEEPGSSQAEPATIAAEAMSDPRGVETSAPSVEEPRDTVAEYEVPGVAIDSLVTSDVPEGNEPGTDAMSTVVASEWPGSVERPEAPAVPGDTAQAEISRPSASSPPPAEPQKAEQPAKPDVAIAAVPREATTESLPASKAAAVPPGSSFPAAKGKAIRGDYWLSSVRANPSVPLSQLTVESSPNPAYPRAAKRPVPVHVRVGFAIAPNGQPVGIDIENGSADGPFGASAIEAVRKWRFAENDGGKYVRVKFVFQPPG